MSVQEIRRKEAGYKLVQRAGTVINLVVSFVAGFLRFVLSIYLTRKREVPQNFVTIDVIFNVLVVLLQLLSGILLLFSLLKIGNGVANIPGATKKRGSFLTHFTVLTCHLISLAVCEFYV